MEPIKFKTQQKLKEHLNTIHNLMEAIENTYELKNLKTFQGDSIIYSFQNPRKITFQLCIALDEESNNYPALTFPIRSTSGDLREPIILSNLDILKEHKHLFNFITDPITKKEIPVPKNNCLPLQKINYKEYCFLDLSHLDQTMITTINLIFEVFRFLPKLNNDFQKSIILKQKNQEEDNENRI